MWCYKMPLRVKQDQLLQLKLASEMIPRKWSGKLKTLLPSSVQALGTENKSCECSLYMPEDLGLYSELEKEEKDTVWLYK